MCGIAGIINITEQPPPSLEQMVAMISPLRYRGPDQSGVYLDHRVALGHLRLSIIGIDGGIQPICNETGELWIVYNGEAYNYLELKQELLARGHRFSTQTDTEVLLHLYEEYGPACLDRINGQFAFAIWDSTKGELFLARDRVGVRPLYYTWSGGQLLFASEIKAILAVTGRRELDPEAVGQLFVFWSTLPGRTFFAGIEALPPGHYLQVKGQPCRPRAYWRIPPPQPEEHCKLELPEATERFAELLEDAVRLRLRADVPVGAYLSGGLDSSIIATLIARHCKSRLKTFSLGFADAAFDESLAQEEMVRHLGTDHRRVLVEDQQIRRLLPETVWHCEQATLRSSPVPMFLLSQLVHSEGYKVVLSGEGADEMLGGYHIFKEAKVRDYWGRRPDSARRPRLLERLYPYIFNNPSRGRSFLQEFFAAKPEQLQDPFFSHAVRWGGGIRNLAFLSPEYRSCLSGYDHREEVARWLPEGFADRDLFSRAQVLEIELFLAGFLLSSQGDRVAMAHSVEMRHPFLDYRVIDFAFRLPAKWKMRGLQEKYLLRRACRHLLPQRIADRPKHPYRAPVSALFTATAPADYVDELLSGPSLKSSGYFDPGKVARLYQRVLEAPPGTVGEFANMALMGVLSTEILHRQFLVSASYRGVRRVSPDLVRYGAERRAEGRDWTAESPPTDGRDHGTADGA
ncbi:asparagine synthase (glutamine-hydrolyzing) [Geomonas paludis]|uniref:asparagine synthase (glutamine-hydrolyzing) n=1 Tax=Geomonas paludis TaxID=2740185 RepID=A0A6V8MXK1_9BACT|nr:asparagine synthase (glutamine-hydrolyzing) [Geomonas paludis]UPU37052.1 asparagine synthase (glutamine-hydrolyzing) [Geomonas paludis]GFO64852.1 asparagine synthetase B [Geomonas paludis]